MSRISEKFIELKNKKQKALITYITAGDPSLNVTEQLVHTLEKSGADIIELGVPFSDPLADGPTIQASHVRALKNKVSVADVLKLIKSIRKKSNIPIALMLSFNLILNYGLDKFSSDSAKAGVDGLICPDLSIDEAGVFIKKMSNLDTIFLSAPTSTEERFRIISETSSGFIYLVSLLGITGARTDLPKDISDNVVRLKKYSKTPVAVGFGISSEQHVKAVLKAADAAIVGSAIVKVIEKNINNKSILKKVGSLVSKLKKATYV